MKRFFKEEDAPTFMEYGLLLALIALVAALGVSIFGEGVASLFQAANDGFPP